MDAIFHLKFLGAVQIERNGKPVRGFRSRKALAILGYLAVQNQPTPREQLADLFWEDKPEATGRANLSWTLNKLASLLPGCLQTDRHTVQFRRTDSYWLDVDTFAALEVQEDVAALAAAVELARGEFMSGLDLDGCAEFGIWLVGERERWRQRVARVLDELVAHHSRRGEYAQSVRFAQHLLALEPWREETHQRVMRLLAQCGQRAAALAQYETCRRVLAEELGIGPLLETTALYERIRAASSAHSAALPLQPTPFVGREKELAEATALLGNPDCRLLTVLGPGGVGKTRLALQAAEATSQAFLEGVYFIPLASVSAPEYLVSAIADAVQFSFSGPQDPRVQLVNYLRGKQVLLVLDNLEHLLDGTELLLEILQKAPEVKLLVTSRERLNVRWEWCFEIGGLEYPADATAEELDRHSAMRLFRQTARRVSPRLALSAHDAPAIQRVCQLVEGMPLGIELAAAWVETRTCMEIAKEIERNQNFLATCLHDVPERHRSIWATFEHSWRLLAPSEQHVLMNLSVFRRGFEPEAAAEVTSASLAILKALADKSLLRLALPGRYEMHELLRQYAAEKLAAAPVAQTAAHDRHCTHYTAFLQRREADLSGPNAAEALTAIKAEIGNVRTAWHWALTQGKTDAIWQGLDGISRFYLLAGLYQEGEKLLEMTVERLRVLVEKADKPAGGPQTSFSKLLAERALFLNRQGKYDQAVAVAQEAVDLAQTERAVGAEALAYLQWGEALWRRGAFDAAEPRLEQGLALARDASLHQVEADSLRSLGNVCHGRAAYAEARANFEQALPIYREIGDRRGESGTLNNLGAVCHYLGDYSGARTYFEQALCIYRQIGDRQIGGAAVHNLARLCRLQGDYARANAHLEEALRIWRDVGDRQGESWGLLHIGMFALEEGDSVKARAYCELALRTFREIGARYGEGLALAGLGQVAYGQGDSDTAMACLEQALLISRETGDRMGESWALKSLGDTCAGNGDYASAQAHLQQALSICREIGYREGESEALASLALLSNCLSDSEAARESSQQALLLAQKIGCRPIQGQALTRLGRAFEGLSRLAKAAENYRQALDIRRELGERNRAMEPLSGLARILLAQGDLAQAQAHVQVILSHLETGSLDGTDEPFQVYLTCYHVLRAAGDARAEVILDTAHRLLQERAAKISDEKLRRSFLENVAAHREIVEAMTLHRKLL